MWTSPSSIWQPRTGLGHSSDLLVASLADRVQDAYLSEVSAAIAAHTGPGVIGVTVHRRL